MSNQASNEMVVLQLYGPLHEEKAHFLFWKCARLLKFLINHSNLYCPNVINICLLILVDQL